MTVIAKIPLPLIEELFDKMVGCIVYTPIDLAQGYHQMIVVKSGRPYTTFRTHKDTYQWCVAPKGVADCSSVEATYQGDTPWNWTKSVEDGYLRLKLALQQVLTLKLPDFERPFIGKTDASEHCIGGILSQTYGRAYHPIVFYSKKLDRNERGWPTHENELLAIKVTTEKWRYNLHEHLFDVYSNNVTCSWMLHHPQVSPKLACFLTHFSQYTFTLHHVRGKMNVEADGLSRSPSEGLEDKEDEEPPLLDMMYTVHYYNEEWAKNAAQVHEHRIRSAQVNTVDYHFVWPHLVPETKRAFQKGYEEDPAFKQ
ncbi:unnamed protein product [Phytophthora fragariaefolia]|uniref:Unnamed protein product n=1 Tax=Phytophthora fragariaefolia TaxID=1490495 RepID=A0A9W6X4Q0_9STRA|nr:unnamed protein product [Phytophthora fragariaefolia]